jgi:hypothetical protein
VTKNAGLTQNSSVEEPTDVSSGATSCRMPTDDFVRRMTSITVLSVSSLLAAGVAVGLALWMAKASPLRTKE